MVFPDSALPRVAGTPDAEHLRSPAALETARLAAQCQLQVANFEHRAVLPWPEPLCPPDMPELAESASWQRGQLLEHKFQSFRHDRMVGSFHPGHRAKWTAHELCHSLVGFAYRPGASRYFHALAAWLSELLPVALYYFFDEAGLRRCPAHAGGGPLYGRFCPACEQVALAGARDSEPDDEVWIQRGCTYVEAELAAWTRARQSGLPRGHRHASLDLCSDGIGYAASHARRLDSELFERFASSFFAPEQGLHADLDALEERVLGVMSGMLHGAALPAWNADRWDWIAQDLGYRLLLVHSETEGEAASELDALIDALAGSRTTEGVAAAEASYRALEEEWVLPEAEQVMALGYALPSGAGLGLAQLAEGLASACPNTWDALPDPDSTLRNFAQADAPERAPLGRRFASWLSRHAPGPLANLARYEAALSHAAPPELCAEGLDTADPTRQACRLAEGVELLQLDHDVVDADRPALAARRDAPLWLAVRATADQHLSIAELSESLAAQLSGGSLPAQTSASDEVTQLAELGFLCPERYEA